MVACQSGSLALALAHYIIVCPYNCSRKFPLATKESFKVCGLYFNYMVVTFHIRKLINNNLDCDRK